MTQDNPEITCEEKIDPRTKKHLLVCSMDIRKKAGKQITDPLKLLMRGKYFGQRRTAHKVLDVLGVVALIATISAAIFLALPKNTPELVAIDASVAPAEVITGDLSTLTFRYENNSNEAIRNARLEFTLPEHFALESIESEALEVGTLTFDLGDIAPTQYGFVHVNGTMFGDVGGDQIFTTSLSYTYSEDDIQDIKQKEHIFQPVRSALDLELSMPEHLISYQLVEGAIRYTNTGSIEFPQLIIAPSWPDSFSLSSSSPTLLSDNTFHVDGIAPGETGIIEFTGHLGHENDSLFHFSPSFKFDTTTYTQTELFDTVEMLPTPLQISHEILESSLNPGDNATVEINYSNIGELDLTDIQLRIESDAPVFEMSGITDGYYSEGYYIFNDIVETLQAGDSGTASMTIPVSPSLSRASTSTYENITVTTRASSDFNYFIDGETRTVNTVGSSFTLPLSSPMTLSSFGRYWGPSGDQLGRGPIPPYAGEQTKYWIFWNLSGTTNELSNLSITADLGPNVTLTGRSSVSTGSSIESSGDQVLWSIGSLEPTLSPTSAVVGIAFEVAITPAESQIGTTPTLLGPATIMATDTWTGIQISSGTYSVTTSIPYDTKAADFGGIVE